MKKTLVSVLCLTICFMLLLSGCQSTTTTSQATSGTTTAATTTRSDNGDDRPMEGNLYLEGFPIVKEKVTLRFFAPHNTAVEDYYTNHFVVTYEEMTNVHIEWDLVPPSGLAEKKNLTFAGGNLPDAFFGSGISFEEAVMYGSQGLLQPLNDLIERYNPQVKKLFAEEPIVKKIVTSPDGNIYQYPQKSDCFHCWYPQKAWINIQWLDRLNLDMPTTTDEFYDVLVAFRDEDANGNGDPNDEIPFSASELGNLTWPVHWIMNAFVLDNRRAHHLVIENGKVFLSALQPEYKEGLLYLRKLYAEGLMDSESFTQDYDMLRQKMQNPDISLVGAAPAMHYLALVGVTGDRPDEYDVIPPLTGPNGVRTSWYDPTRVDASKYVITTDSQYPEVAARWIDYFYTEEGLLAQKYGRENEEWYHPDPASGEMGHGEGMDPAPARFNWMPGKGWSETLQNITLNQQGPIWETREFRGAWTADPAAPLEPRLIEATKKYLGTEMKEFWPPLMMTKEETDELRVLRTQINDYIHEMNARFVTGDVDIERGWQEFISTLENQLSAKRYIEICQQAYDRFMSN